MSKTLPRLPGYFSLAEVAKLDNTALSNISSCVRSGRLAAVHVGRHVLISDDDCAAFLARKRYSAPGVLSVRAMERVTGISVYIISKAIERGELKTVKRPGLKSLFIREEDAAAWARKRKK